MYLEIYNLIESYIYGGVIAGSYQELVCTMVATAGCLFLVALPFILVVNIIKILTRF